MKKEELEKQTMEWKNNYILKLEKEIAKLKSRDCWKSCEYAEPKAELIGQHIKDVQNLSKAIALLKWALHSDPEHDEDFEKKWEEAEQFISEVEK